MHCPECGRLISYSCPLAPIVSREGHRVLKRHKFEGEWCPAVVIHGGRGNPWRIGRVV
jgi:hypothetical protein